MSQFAFALQLPPVFSEENFSVFACNRDAWAEIMRWPDWPGKALLIHGPQGCGKTHLAYIWAAHSGAIVHDARQGAFDPAAIQNHMLIENIEAIEDERILFHTLNYAREHGFTLLLTSGSAPAEWTFALPDLLSRLRALNLVAIAPPDDEALTHALSKQFADRQIEISPDAIAYLLPRMERSFAGAKALVEKLDAESLQAKRGLTVPFLKRALGC